MDWMDATELMECKEHPVTQAHQVSEQPYGDQESILLWDPFVVPKIT